MGSQGETERKQADIRPASRGAASVVAGARLAARSSAAVGSSAAAGSSITAGAGGDEDTADRLLLAAGPIFAASGFERATVREICKAAGVNVAAIGYHFGDKMGLYVEVVSRIQGRREHAFPLPSDADLPAEQRLRRRIQLLLLRLLSDQNEDSWETQLMMREMQQPTAVFEQVVRQYFRPLFSEISGILAQLTLPGTKVEVCHRLAFSVVGQCLYYRIGRQAIRLLVSEQERAECHQQDALVEHITSVTLAAASSPQVCQI